MFIRVAILDHEGVLKMHLRADDFIRCARSDPPENSLLHISNPVSMDDLQRYIDLVEGMFKLSPMGSLIVE